jgi:hypothetical protein
MRLEPAAERLRDTMKAHGFYMAASKLDVSGRHAQHLLLEWRYYPECMNVYPTQLKAKPHYER